jgi:AraC-like DNA-binding protein
MSIEIRSSDHALFFRREFSGKDFEASGFRSNDLDYRLPFVEVKGKEWIFNGIKMLYTEANYSRYVALPWKSTGGVVTMHFNLKGTLSQKDLQTGTILEFSNNRHNIFYDRGAEGVMKTEELQAKALIVQFSKDTFFRIAHQGNDAIQRFADAVAADRFTSFSDANLPIDFALHNCINTILNCPFSDSLKALFLFSKSIELLVLQAEAFDRANRNPAFIKCSGDRERILFARDYLLQNMDCPPSLTQLAHMAGINEYKLKRGFKEMFNLTAFQYLSAARLDVALRELQEGKKNLTEIASDLGYASLQHFSNAFKKKFGVSPSGVK